MAKHAEQASKKWGFDFTAGLPINSHSQFIWERVPPAITPEMYMCVSRAAHIREDLEIASTSSERLMDERAYAASRNRDLLNIDAIAVTKTTSSPPSPSPVTHVRLTRSIQPKITG